ncbi:hypothetical protein EI545_03390 [Tabrizicola piscis]|uniref:Uncharacterized protein n=1 Tax=Tabrizicola piscis TaxID=2494374 RepID=A0A3S8U2W6_9RHOB|nr:hypothetical protein [Tabrizicola piscis]AZL57964.1 hypothetical protein EI545_03390 [Tabrizicola piscis]
MKSFLSAAFLACLTAPLAAQELAPLPDEAPLYDAVMANISGQVPEGRFIDSISRWQADVVGDTTPDQIVQAVVGYDGGNGYDFWHWIFIGAEGGFAGMFPIQLNGGAVTAVRLDGEVLAFTLSTYLPSDARCCPTGVEVIRMPLR